MNTIYRQTYSILDWLGDVGGLYDAIMLIMQFATLPISTFALRAHLLSVLFRFIESYKEEEKNDEHNSSKKMRSSFLNSMFNSKDTEEETLIKSLKGDFQILQSFRKLSWFASFFKC